MSHKGDIDSPAPETSEQWLDGDFPWPRSDDRLVTEGGPHWQLNAMIMQGQRNRWWLYACGYKEAADTLVDQIKQGHRHQDFLVYPIMFLYRQYLELAIKGLIQKAWALLDEEENDVLGNHDIRRYWSKCRKLLERVAPGDSLNEQGYIAGLIDEFCQHDPTSFSFRYPVTKPKDGERRQNLQDLEAINLRNVQDVIANAAGLLDAAETHIDYLLDLKSDMARELASHDF